MTRREDLFLFAKNGKKLNLGCGGNYRDGWVNLDCNKQKKVDVLHDLNKFPYPFRENTFDYVLMHNILEHLNDPYHAIEELVRVCKDRAIIEIWVPHFSCCENFKDMTHCKRFSVDTVFPRSITVREKRIIWSRKKFLRKISPIFDFLINKVFRTKNFNFYEYYLAWVFPAHYIYFRLEIKKENKN